MKVLRYFAVLSLCSLAGWIILHQSANESRIYAMKSSHYHDDGVETQPVHRLQKTSRIYAMKSSHYHDDGVETQPVHRLQKTRPMCILGRMPPILEQLKEAIVPDVTIVTAYFNLGKLKKSGRVSYEPKTYMKWAETFRHLLNPTVFYTDSEEIEKQFTKIRGDLKNITKIIRLDRTSLWSFKLINRIQNIFSIPGYPKHSPNTVLPEYSCTQHAKYDCLEDTVFNDYFRTKYVTWLDIGYFRYIIHRKRKFQIVRPRNFDESRVAMNEINTVNMTELANVIIKGNHVWVGGGMVFGVRTVIKDFIKDYRRAVERYINMGFINTDQQVIFAMNTKREKNILKSKVKLQVYSSDIKMDCWFYLGYSCYREIN